MADIKIGDEVRLFAYGTRAGRNLPEGGGRGTVTKVGRKYATATFEGAAREISFDMETGSERGDYRTYYVRTPAQVEAEQRRDAAVVLLKEAGFELRLGHHPEDDLIERPPRPYWTGLPRRRTGLELTPETPRRHPT